MKVARPKKNGESGSVEGEHIGLRYVGHMAGADRADRLHHAPLAAEAAVGERDKPRIGGSGGGRGADAALECVGATIPIKLAIDAVRKGATVTLIGNVSPTIELPLQSAVSRQIRLQGSCASSGEYRECIRLMSSGKIKVEPLISAVAPLAQGADWFRRLHAREPGLLKVVLEP